MGALSLGLHLDVLGDRGRLEQILDGMKSDGAQLDEGSDVNEW